MILNDLLNPSIAITDNMNLTQAAYLLSAIVNGFGSQTVGPDVSQVGIQYYMYNVMLETQCHVSDDVIIIL